VKITKKPFRTSQIAAGVGVHPNTVRLYEEWGFLQAVPRGVNGYRLYDEGHLDQMRLARTALHGGWPGRLIRRSALSLVRLSASGDLRGAMEQARTHLALVRGEREQAEAAAAFLEDWARGARADSSGGFLSIGGAAKKLSLTVDTLRSWERTRLIKPPRNPNGYRSYGSREIGRLRVIRMLYLAGYSTMSILRFMSGLDSGISRGNARKILDTPGPDEDVYSASDRWLTSLSEQERRAETLIVLLKSRLSRY
jgi:DNA-binding transcriptional MerR regulator